MLGHYPYAKRYHYPHLAPADATIWERYLAVYPDAYDTVDYDFRCGKGPEIDPTLPDNIQRDAYTLGQKRIDVVGYRADGTFIIELKPRAGTTAIGQVITYLHCMAQDHPELAPFRGVIITDSTQPDIPDVAAAHGITIITV